MAPLEKEKNPMSSTTLSQFALGKKNNDHGVDVSMIIIIFLRHIENNGILSHSHQIHL